MTQRFYTAGLLHDLGRVALFVVSPQAAAAWMRQTPPAADSLRAEKEIFGLDHQQAGVHLAARWKYPAPLHKVIAGLHPPADAGPPAEEDPLLGVVGLADSLARAWGDHEVPGAVAEVDSRRAARLGFGNALPAKLAELIQLRLEEDPGEGV